MAESRLARALGVVLLVTVAMLALSASAGAIRFPASGLRFFADVSAKPPSRTTIEAETIRGSFSALSLRTVRDVRVHVTRAMEGKVVGQISAATERAKLVMPRGASRLSGARQDVVLSRRPRVVLHAVPVGGLSGGPAVISIGDLPAGTRFVSLTLDGAGRGLIGVPHGCPVRPTMVLYAQRSGAPPASSTSGVFCGVPYVRLLGTPQVGFRVVRERGRTYVSMAALVRLSSSIEPRWRYSLLAAPGLRDGQLVRAPAGGFFGGTSLGRVGAKRSRCHIAEPMQLQPRTRLGQRTWKLGLRGPDGRLVGPVKTIAPRRASGDWEAAAIRRLGC